MPITRGAIKKQRQDIKRKKVNLLVKKAVKDSVKKFKKNPSRKLLDSVYSNLDKARKKGIFHKNKASRLKSRLSKLIKSAKKSKKEPAKTIKRKNSKKTAADKK